MRIGVFSDTHGDISHARLFYDSLAPLDCLFHLGDYAADGAKLSRLFSCPVYAVRGNCDYRSEEPLERIVDLAGKRFLLLHSHQYYHMSALLYRGEEVHADMVLYGHTHVPAAPAEPRLPLPPPGRFRGKLRPDPGGWKGPSGALHQRGQRLQGSVINCSSFRHKRLAYAPLTGTR